MSLSPPCLVSLGCPCSCTVLGSGTCPCPHIRPFCWHRLCQDWGSDGSSPFAADAVLGTRQALCSGNSQAEEERPAVCKGTANACTLRLS